MRTAIAAVGVDDQEADCVRGSQGRGLLAVAALTDVVDGVVARRARRLAEARASLAPGPVPRRLCVNCLRRRNGCVPGADPVCPGRYLLRVSAGPDGCLSLGNVTVSTSVAVALVLDGLAGLSGGLLSERWLARDRRALAFVLGVVVVASLVLLW